jgi:hypothetical protein
MLSAYQIKGSIIEETNLKQFTFNCIMKGSYKGSKVRLRDLIFCDEVYLDSKRTKTVAGLDIVNHI